MGNETIENKRNANFTEGEINILIMLVKKYKTIIENKKTDAVMWKQKQEAWIKLSEEFNAITGGSARTMKSIRGKYENLEKTVKKFAEEKRELYKTGRGTSDNVIKITPTDIAVKEVMGISVDGLVNQFDSDSLVIEGDSLLTQGEIIINETSNNNNDHSENVSGIFHNPRSASLLNNIQLEAANVELPNLHPSTAGNTATNILNENTHIKSTNAAMNLDKNVASTSNNTLQATVMSSSNTPPRKIVRQKKTELTNDCRIKINGLSVARLELITLQKEYLREEMKIKNAQHEQKLSQDKVEHELRVEESRLRIELLKKQLHLV